MGAMTTSAAPAARAPLAAPASPAPGDASRLLLGAGAGDALAAALAPTGLRVAAWRVDAVHDRPGAETSVGYVLEVVARGTADGAPDVAVPVPAYVVLSTADLPDAPGVARLTAPDGTALTAWAHPDDPRLPALRTATTPALLAGVLRAAGDATSVDGVEVRTYRPLRRAVVAATTDAGPRWAKALRPAAADGLVQRLALLRTGDVDVPATVAHVPGLVVLGPAAGRPLAEHLVADTSAGSRVAAADRAPSPPGGVGPVGARRSASAPTGRSVVVVADADPDTDASADGVSAAHVLDLLDRLDALPATARALPRRRPWADRLDAYAAALVATVPDLDDPVADLVDVVRHDLAATDAGPSTVTHGDLHPANLWWEPRTRRLGLIDVDTLGPGHRVDDLACLVAHLTVLPSLDPGYRAVPGRRDAWLAAFDRVVDPVGLRARAAAVVLSLAAGRPGEHLARTWVSHACDLVRPPSTSGRRQPASAERRAS